jgi:hypothetical protein
MIVLFLGVIGVLATYIVVDAKDMSRRGRATQKVNKQIMNSITDSRDDAGLLLLTKEVSVLADKITELEEAFKNISDNDTRSSGGTIVSTLNEQFLPFFEKISNIEELLKTVGDEITFDNGKIAEKIDALDGKFAIGGIGDNTKGNAGDFGLIKDEIINLANSIRQRDKESSGLTIEQLRGYGEEFGEALTKRLKGLVDGLNNLELINLIIEQLKGIDKKLDGSMQYVVDDTAEENGEIEDTTSDYIEEEEYVDEINPEENVEATDEEEKYEEEFEGEKNGVADVGMEDSEENTTESGEEYGDNKENIDGGEGSEEEYEGGVDGDLIDDDEGGVEEEDGEEYESEGNSEGNEAGEITVEEEKIASKTDEDSFFESDGSVKNVSDNKTDEDSFFESDGNTNKISDAKEDGDDFFESENKGENNIKEDEDDVFGDVKNEKNEIKKEENIGDDIDNGVNLGGESGSVGSESNAILENLGDNQDIEYEAMMPEEVKTDGFSADSDIPAISFEDFLMNNEKGDAVKDKFWGNASSAVADTPTAVATSEVVGSDEALKNKIKALKERINEEKTE